MNSHDLLSLEAALAVFDEHLRRTRGVCAGTRRNYARFVRAFLQAEFADGPVQVARLHWGDVVGFVAGLTSDYRPRTVELAASALRAFLRFLRAAGLREDRLEDAVPMVPHRPSGLVRHLDPAHFEQLIASLDSSSPRGLRDRAMILCMARLGLRSGEVVGLRLEDLDWRNGSVRVRARKTGHGALLPLPVEVGVALADYLQRARADTQARQVFVLHRQRVGAPISASIVVRAVDNALRRAGMAAPGVEGTCCATRWPPSCSVAAPACARSPTCSGIPRWPPPASTPRSTSRRCARWPCRGRGRRHDRRRRRDRLCHRVGG
jgi:integrase/recombinase XerD